jgi:protein-S-isoprenylcysteine O-methyltransferase Ste14
MNKSKYVKMALVFFVAVWLMAGVLLTSTVEDIIRTGSITFIRPTSPLATEDYVLFLAILALILGTMFVGKVKSMLDRSVAGGLLIFHSFPAFAWLLQPELYGMLIPAGIFTLLCSPSNVLFTVPQTRWLLSEVLPSEHYPTLALFSFLLFLSGITIFIVALIQLLNGKNLVTSGLYSIVRHPQYLGIILATLGLTLWCGTRLISLIAWTLLIVAYVWLAYREESNLQEKYGTEFLAYKKKVPFILPLRAGSVSTR